MKVQVCYSAHDILIDYLAAPSLAESTGRGCQAAISAEVGASSIAISGAGADHVVDIWTSVEGQRGDADRLERGLTRSTVSNFLI